MRRYARRIHIEAPVAAVWAAIVDVEAWPAWAPQFKRIERLDSGPLASGSRVHVRPNWMPGAVWQVTDYEEGRSLTWAPSLVPGLRISGGHIVLADGAATNAEFSLAASGPLGTLLGPVLHVTVFSRNTRGATQGLKRYMEARGPGA